jgi:hypothetical protein
MDSVTAIKNRHRDRIPGDASLVVHYQSLTAAQARQLASYALELLELLDKEEDNQAEDILLHLACLAPGGLEGIHKTLLDRQLYYPGVLFRNAGPESRERLIESLPGTGLTATNQLLLALAWIGDDRVQETFQVWRDEKPHWASSLYVPPEAYAQEAGWELTPGGQRRDLFFHQCYPLIKSENESELKTNPVRVVTDHQGRCEWCGRDLVALLDLDLANAPLGFLGFEGDRLRIATCDVCTCFGPVYTEVEGNGGAKWSGQNSRPTYLPEDTPAWGKWQESSLVLGKRPRDPFSAVDDSLPISPSQVGGHPTWVQDAQYPSCPSCTELMMFLGQVAAKDIDVYGEGIHYSFLCATCGVACTRFQQT